MADVKLNWGTAEVKDGKLAVELEGEAASDWKQSFEATLALLPGGDWGTVQLKKHTVRVSDLSPGSEERLRHHLKSVVEQANAAVRPSEPDGDERGEDEGDPDSPDARMTESFRAFAEGEEAETSSP
ncbi:MAG: hypothetical protein M3065_13430 [Actinomycetota bacterium]|nr:hypothetical protein [Actinomycetota bacterium]